MEGQESIFDGLEVPSRPKKRAKAVKAAAYGACSHCTNTHVGLVPSLGGKHLIWRLHNRKVGSTSVPCPGSGTYVCEQPARDAPHINPDTPFCPHS